MTTYSSTDIATIPVDRPKRVKSSLEIQKSGRVASMTLRMVIHHDRPSDLRMMLVTPNGRQILVRERNAGELGAVTMEVPQATNESLNGRWQLWIDDVKPGDGGTLGGWSLEVSTFSSPLLIELDFQGLTLTQQDVFRSATERLQRLLVATKKEALTLKIKASGIKIDGRGGILGQAGPTSIRGSDGLPTRGIMEFDASDIVRMEINGSLASLLIHEMGHVLGFGTLFRYHKLVTDGKFTGPAASREYASLLANLSPTPVPLEDEGGPGTAGGHWDEQVFRHECFTGYMTGAHQPISRVSAGAFEDLGYEVDYSQADPYLLGMLGLVGPGGRSRQHCGGVTRPEFEVL